MKTKGQITIHKRKTTRHPPEDGQTESPTEVSTSAFLSADLDVNVGILRGMLGKSSDIIFRTLFMADGRAAALIYVDALSDNKLINQNILKRLTSRPESSEHTSRRLTLDALEKEFVTVATVDRVRTVDDVLHRIIVENDVVLLFAGESVGLSVGAGGGENRAIEEPETEAVIRGPREGFNENLRTSLSLIRRRIRTPDLVVETFRIGTMTKTKVALCYINGLIDPSIVEEARTRLQRIDTDSIIDAGYIEEYIEDNPYSPFPQIQNTERPDVVAASLLEGRVAIITDGSPFALLAPINLWSSLQAAEDYYERYTISNLIRWLRYLFLFFALYLPSLYVAITTFHQEMLPTKLLLSVAAAREITPFPAVVECLIMEVTFEALREAGVRLPKTIGSAISIVGALVIGQAAVEAGIVSAPMVIVVAVTGIASFVIPRFNFAISIRMLRFPMIILAGTLGLFGVVMASIVIVIHVCSLRSLGVPFLEPVAPFNWKNIGDVIVRAPHWAMRRRPMQTSKLNRQRQSGAMTPQNRIPLDKRRT